MTAQQPAQPAQPVQPGQSRERFVTPLAILVILLSLALVFLLSGGADLLRQAGISINGWGNGQGQAAVNLWQDEDGYADVGNTATPRFYSWVATYISANYPGATIQDHGSWKQAFLPDGLVVSWAEWGNPLILGSVDGLYEGKPLFVAMRDYAPWVDDSNVNHIECSGTYIPSYSSNSMSNWDVHFSTILQFDGSTSGAFVNNMTQAWNAVRASVSGCP